MEAGSYLQELLGIVSIMKILEFAAMVSGLLCVWFLIKQNILTWPFGIIYVLISFVIFIDAKLYADFILHIFFLALNIYGWYYWLTPSKTGVSQLSVTTTSSKLMAFLIFFSFAAIYLSGRLLTVYTDASLPYWDSATSVLSISAMWLTAKKKIENWIFWFVVNLLATGIYYYKGIYFYCILYMVYIGMAIAGYRAWRKTMISISTNT